MNQRGRENLRMWLLGAAAIGVPSALGLFGTEQIALGDGKISLLLSNKKATIKTAAAKPAISVATEPPRLLPVPDGNSFQIQTVSDSQVLAANGRGDKSEVMKQLELLYEKDGKEMPELQSMQPMPTGGTPPEVSGVTRPSVPSQQTAPVNSGVSQPRMQMPQAKYGSGKQAMPSGSPTGVIPASPPPPVAPAPTPSKNPVTGFFKKLIPGNKDAKTTAAPQNYQPNVAPTPPNTRPQPRAAEYTPAQVFAEPTPAPSAYSLTPLSQAPATPVSGTTSNPQQPGLLPGRSTSALNTAPRPASAFFGLPPSPLEVSNATAPSLAAPTSVSLPPLLPQPVSTATELPPLTAENAEQSLTLPTAPTKSVDADNPFTEMSEAEADSSDGADPFTGLTLDEDNSPGAAANKNTGASPKNGPTEAGAADDPFAEELRKLGILPPLEKGPTSEQSSSKLAMPLQEPSAADSPLLSLPSLDGIEDEATREKISKIRERGGMKGLKGFCPVTLHDERELVDAKPDHHATHRGQKFHFASVEAMSKFAEEPSRYAPAAYGADVVALTRDKDVVEGSLDFAAWFKGRLYLFGSQEAHDTFVANPVQFATPAGIE